ncbi:MAG: hypothetical protein KKB39_04000 [Nanoarchaeota archaeon]|nr:hypothetical protein [Nanoarchaeota archaeon]
MVNFGTDYWNGMSKKPIEQINLSTKDIGVSMGIGDPWVNLKSAVTAGANHVELGFMGVGRGSINQPTGVTPGTIGKEKREDIRQMAKINDVTLSTHASANITGFAGMGEKRFDQAVATESMKEVKRAIDFAADTAEGGPIVVHTGEFPRGISEAGKEFEAYPDEERKAMLGLVDTQTGEITAITRDITLPKLETENVNGINVPKVDKDGNYVYKDWGYKDFKDEEKKTNIPAEKLFYQAYLDKERLRASAEEKRWSQQAEEAKKAYDLVMKKVNSVKELEKKNKKGADYAAMIYAEEMQIAPSKADYKEHKKFLENPQEYLEKGLKLYKKSYNHALENFEAAGRQRVDVENRFKSKDGKERIQPLKEYAIEESAKNIAQLGLYAMAVEKKRGLKKPLSISPENVFAERYGGHPQELKELILKSRKAMATELVSKQKYSQKQAEKMAEERIKATFDIGHANIWRKYFKTEEGKDSDVEFKKWFSKQVKDLMDNKIIGHVHMADNFGYADEHLTPGQGNAPIEEFMKEFKKAGLKDKIIVEPGAQGEGENIMNTMLGAWAKVAGSPMYRVGNVSKSWTDIEGSYFGRTFSSSYMAGGYLINPKSQEDNWWSGVPLE